ncbi:MAG: adenylosuccinate lyase [Chloroflexota bacterium]
MKTDFDTYLSPFSWRYGSSEMRGIWSEANKRRLWRRIWVVLAQVQAEFGLVRREQADDLRAHAEEIDIPRAIEVEMELHHDLMAEIQVYAEQCPEGGGIIHLGATSMDIKDHATLLQIREALDRISGGLRHLLFVLSQKMLRYNTLPIIAFTHLQPAEPSTLGYRLAQYAQDLLEDWEDTCRVRDGLRGKGFRGAVGTGASYVELLGADKFPRFEARLSEELGVSWYPVSTQTYPRKQEYQVLNVLAGLGASLHKFALDLRVLQSPPLGELSEPFSVGQVGSSAMPFKRNPIQAEKMNSLARLLAQLPRVAWDNAAFSLLERTLDDSANRRSILPEAFLIADELIKTATSIIQDLQVEEAAMSANLKTYAPFAATERVLVALVKAGADRQVMYRRLHQHALKAWEAVKAGQANPISGFVTGDEELLRYLPEKALQSLMEAEHYLGDAPDRTRTFAESIIGRLEGTE